MIFLLRFAQAGGHIHCRLFQATAAGHTWQRNGELVFDEPGWAAFSALVHGRVELVPEDVWATFSALVNERLDELVPEDVPDCDCRHPRCGHKASRHVGTDGACVEAGCPCGPGGWR